MSGAGELTVNLFRRQSGHIVAGLARRFGASCLDLIEDAVQDAFVRALERWPYEGIPENPAGWIAQVARHCAIDALRRTRSFEEKVPDVVHAITSAAVEEREDPFGDDDLALIFLCCHPELPEESRIALALKTACGFSVSEIARALLAGEAAVAQRLVRAKRIIRDRGLSFDMPESPEMLSERRASVLSTIYLMFNEGYAATSGWRLLRHDICEEAVRLAALTAGHPRTTCPEAYALAALLLLQAARFPARESEDGEITLLADQDRSAWDGKLIAAGLRYLARSADGPLTRYHLEAEIASLHAAAPSLAETNWPRIVSLYDSLLQLVPTPVVALNRAVAIAHASGPQAGIEAVNTIRFDPVLAHSHLLPAVLGELYSRAGDTAEAGLHFENALAKTTNAAERRFIERRLGR